MMTMLRKLICNQTFLLATNGRRTDTERHRHIQGRIETHTHLASVACVVSLVKSGGRQSQGESYDDDAAKTLLQPNFFASNQRAQDGCTEE